MYALLDHLGLRASEEERERAGRVASEAAAAAAPAAAAVAEPAVATSDGTAMANNLEFVSQLCDVLLVATSSYGDGDPPSNMRNLTELLRHEASMNSDALVGVHHAVLGFGSTTYTTFQNIPRLTDKFLGDCGSRRLVQPRAYS